MKILYYYHPVIKDDYILDVVVLILEQIFLHLVRELMYHTVHDIKRMEELNWVEYVLIDK